MSTLKNYPDSFPGKYKILIYSGSILLFIVFAILISFAAPVKFLIKFTHDDSYYYLKIADNIAKGLGSTFDTINETNGYHPIWLLVVSFIYFLTHLIADAGSELLLRVISFFHIILAGIISYILFKTHKVLYNNNLKLQKLLLALLFCFILVFTHDWGLESNLACLILSIIVYVKTRELFYRQNYIIPKTLLLTAFIFTRIDYPITVLPLLIFSDFITSDIKFRKKNLVIICVSLLVASISYYSYNYFVYGHFLNISSTILNTFPKIEILRSLNELMQPQYYPSYDIKIMFLISVIIYFTFVNKKKLRDSFKIRDIKHSENEYPEDINNHFKYDFFIWSICLGFFFLIILYMMFTEGIRDWYLTVPSFAAILLFIRILDKHERIINKLLIFSLILGIVYFYLTRIENSVYGNSYDFAVQLRNILPEKSRTLQGNVSGIVGFFSERKIINGDGLVNSFEYFKMAKDSRLPEFIKKNKIEFYCTFTGGFNKDSSDYFIDVMHSTSNKIPEYTFKFPRQNLIFAYPYISHHVLGNKNLEWHLFKFND